MSISRKEAFIGFQLTNEKQAERELQLVNGPNTNVAL
jgi:hypothetical protein